MEPLFGTLIVVMLFIMRFALPFGLTLVFGRGMNRLMKRWDTSTPY